MLSSREGKGTPRKFGFEGASSRGCLGFVASGSWGGFKQGLLGVLWPRGRFPWAWLEGVGTGGFGQGGGERFDVSPFVALLFPRYRL